MVGDGVDCPAGEILAGEVSPLFGFLVGRAGFLNVELPLPSEVNIVAVDVFD